MSGSIIMPSQTSTSGVESFLSISSFSADISESVALFIYVHLLNHGYPIAIQETALIRSCFFPQGCFLII